MTESEVNQVLESFDQIARLSGQQTFSEVISQFNSSLPNEYREVVLSQIKEDTAKAILESMTTTSEAISKASNDPTLLEKLKAMGPKADG